MLIFRRIFLSNYWWQRFDIWSQASDSYFLFAEERGYQKWAIWFILIVSMIEFDI
jgi:hypothetical protein